MTQRPALVERAVGRLADVQASISGLDDEDLLDLADIFSGKIHTAMWVALCPHDLGKDARRFVRPYSTQML